MKKKNLSKNIRIIECFIPTNFFKNIFGMYLQYFGKLYNSKVNEYLHVNLFSFSVKVFPTFFFGNDCIFTKSIKTRIIFNKLITNIRLYIFHKNIYFSIILFSRIYNGKLKEKRTLYKCSLPCQLYQCHVFDYIVYIVKIYD